MRTNATSGLSRRNRYCDIPSMTVGVLIRNPDSEGGDILTVWLRQTQLIPAAETRILAHSRRARRHGRFFRCPVRARGERRILRRQVAVAARWTEGCVIGASHQFFELRSASVAQVFKYWHFMFT